MELVFFAGGSIKDNNKGCQALGFGGIAFIRKENECSIVIPTFTKRRREDYSIDDIVIDIKNVKGKGYSYLDIFIAFIELQILRNNKPRNKLSKDLARCSVIYNVSGGDSFSDIYGPKQFLIFMLPSIIALMFSKKLILLPQTIGPFKRGICKCVAKFILRKSDRIYVRDTEFVEILKTWKINFIEEYDLSSHMPKQCVDKYKIVSSSIGVNISGLAYFSTYKHLSGHFDQYQNLCLKLITRLLKNNEIIWLVPHTYKKNNPDGTDDLSAIYDLYEKLPSTDSVYIIDDDFNGMELKYIISNFSYFIGGRMHACLAAIFTGVPVFGLAYSYKFKGSFEKMKKTGDYYDINYLKENEIDNLVSRIEAKITRDRKHQN